MPKTLLGRWKLLQDGSDYFPGLDSLADAPLILRLLGNADIEFYRIEKKKYVDVEELQFTYASKGISMSRSYQIGTLNYENINGTSINLAIVQNCDDMFHEFTLLRIGPKPGQMSRELFKLDPGTDIVKLTIEITTAEGTRLKLIKYLSRFDENDQPENIIFKHANNTMGWKLFEYWPSSVLTNAEASIAKVLKIKFQSTVSQTPTKILETLWSHDGIEDATEEIDWSTVPKYIGTKDSDGDDVVVFIVKVKVADSSWYIARRYSEFDALRKFLLGQNPYNTDFQQMDNKFPGKTLGVSFRRNALDKRIEGLDSFVTFYLDSARFCRQNSIDALCSFLQLPDNMHRIAQLKAAVEPPSPPPLAKARSGSVTSSTNLSSSTAAAKSPDSPNSRGDKLEKSKSVNFLGLGQKKQPQGTQDTSSSVSAGSNSNAVSSSSAATLPTKADRQETATVTSATSTTTSNAVEKQHTKLAANPAKPPLAQAPRNNRQDQTVAPGGIAQTQNKMPFFDEPALSAAQARLSKGIGAGITVIKHGRQGAPKTRILTCDDDVTALIIQASDHYKKIPLQEVEAIRLGTDIDPVTPADALARLNAAETASVDQSVTGNHPAEAKMRRHSSLRFLGGGGDKDKVLYGTAILRRTCKPDDMHLCISLIMENRSVDIQCQNSNDLNLLYGTLQEICNK